MTKSKKYKILISIGILLILGVVSYIQSRPGGKLYVLQNQLMHKYCDKTARPDLSKVDLHDILNEEKGILFRDLGVTHTKTLYYGKSEGCYSELEVHGKLHYISNESDKEKTLKLRDPKTGVKSIKFSYKVKEFDSDRLLADFERYVAENVSTQMVDTNEAKITFNKAPTVFFNTLSPLSTNQDSQTIKLSGGYTFTFDLRRDSMNYWKLSKIEFANITTVLNDK